MGVGQSRLQPQELSLLLINSQCHLAVISSAIDIKLQCKYVVLRFTAVRMIVKFRKTQLRQVQSNHKYWVLFCQSGYRSCMILVMSRQAVTSAVIAILWSPLLRGYSRSTYKREKMTALVRVHKTCSISGYDGYGQYQSAQNQISGQLDPQRCKELALLLKVYIHVTCVKLLKRLEGASNYQ